MTDALPEQVAHVVEVPVRFSDLDSMGHVNNARYLTFLEEARLSWFGALGRRLGVDVMDAGAIIARIEIDYVRPVLLAPEPLRVAVGVCRVGRSSFTLAYTVEQAGEVAARATSVVVTYDYASGSSRTLPEPLVALLRGRLVDAAALRA